MHCSRKKVSKSLRQKLVQWKMKNSNVPESPISLDTLIITNAESGVKRRVPKVLLECSMQNLYNELIALPEDLVLLETRHTNTNDVIFSDTTFVI